MSEHYLPGSGLLAKKLEKISATEGLIHVGSRVLAPMPEYDCFKKWLAQGAHGDMAYLERYGEVRKDPRKLLPGARSAHIFAWRYAQRESARAASTVRPLIAQYARHSDYHKHLKAAIERVVQIFLDGLGLKDEGRVFCDSVPLLERALAAKLPGYFIGKNTCLIHKKRGSFILIGEWISTLPLTDESIQAPVAIEKRGEAGGCGSCRRCQVHCPSGALSQDYRLDARKCISYWTIEHRGVIPREFWPALRTYVYGCDICQNVCPYNRLDQPVSQLSGMRSYDFPELEKVVMMSQSEYEHYFGGSPMTRAKKSGLQRNALISMYVRKEKNWQKCVSWAKTQSDEVLRQTAVMIEEDASDKHS